MRLALVRFGLPIFVASMSVAMDSPKATEHEVVVVDPSIVVDEVWTEKSFGTPTRYRASIVDGLPAIVAEGKGSASGLFRDLRFRVRDYPIIEWSWRVDRLPVDADIRVKAADDVGASLFLIFGRPGFFRPEPPTLVYSWTSAATPRGSIVPSPYHAGTMRTIVSRSGTDELGRWVFERRDIAADFRRAFGTDPPEHVEAIAIWSDGDQTGAQVRALYGRAVVRRN